MRGICAWFAWCGIERWAFYTEAFDALCETRASRQVYLAFLLPHGREKVVAKRPDEGGRPTRSRGALS
jgi:hypothetical protein